MLKKNKIGICFYASNKMGYGHLYRSIYLGNLLKRKYNIFLISNCKNKEVSLDADDITFVCCKENNFKDYLSKNYFDILIIDKLNNNETDIVFYKSCSDKLILIDDMGDFTSLADILINPTSFLPVQHPSKSFFGVEYFVFNDELEYFANKPIIFNSEIKNVLMSFGGSDPNKISEIMIPIIKKYNHIMFTLIIGPGYLEIDNFINLYHSIPNLKILVNVSNMPELIYHTDICVCSGGVTMYECAYLHKKMVVACQVPDQIDNVHCLEEYADIVNLGIINNNQQKKLELLEEILTNGNPVITKKCRPLINGKYKIMNIIDNLMEEILNVK